jgi:hypothetical protein
MNKSDDRLQHKDKVLLRITYRVHSWGVYYMYYVDWKGMTGNKFVYFFLFLSTIYARISNC